jgi:hypothetical protein
VKNPAKHRKFSESIDFHSHTALSSVQPQAPPPDPLPAMGFRDRPVDAAAQTAALLDKFGSRRTSQLVEKLSKENFG